MGAPAYVIYACLLLLMAAALTLGYCAVYNMDSKQVIMINRNCAPSKGRMIEQVGILHGKG